MGSRAPGASLHRRRQALGDLHEARRCGGVLRKRQSGLGGRPRRSCASHQRQWSSLEAAASGCRRRLARRLLCRCSPRLGGRRERHPAEDHRWRTALEPPARGRHGRHQPGGLRRRRARHRPGHLLAHVPDHGQRRPHVVEGAPACGPLAHGRLSAGRLPCPDHLPARPPLVLLHQQQRRHDLAASGRSSRRRRVLPHRPSQYPLRTVLARHGIKAMFFVPTAVLSGAQTTCIE